MKTTEDLTNVLLQTEPEALDETLRQAEEKLFTGERPFADYVRALIRRKGLRQQDVFLAADIPERYGYKLVSEERHTHRRDTILRLCFGARCTPEEAQRVLQLQGLAPLYARIARDAALLVALNRRIYEIADVNAYLEQHDLAPLAPCGDA